MDEAFVNEMRARLVASRETLERVTDADRESSAPVELDQSRVGRLSRMDAMQAQAMAQASGRRREEALRQVIAALARIDSDDYGYCADCEEPIPENRLSFDPAARRCVGCAAKAEQ